ncbi:MAG: hypothetical protein KIT48_16860 [Pseudolabrys sp.]|nr:hypothetical protein [Pseudolabrys sp.]
MIRIVRIGTAKQNALSIALFDDGLFSSMRHDDQRAHRCDAAKRIRADDKNVSHAMIDRIIAVTDADRCAC